MESVANQQPETVRDHALPDITSVTVVGSEGRDLLVPVRPKVDAYVGRLHGISAFSAPVDVFADIHASNVLSL